MFEILFFSSFYSIDQSKSCIEISEVMPSPKNIDFNGDTLLDSNDEYIELYNCGDISLNLQGYVLTDGSKNYQFAQELWLDPERYYVLYKNVSKISLNNDSDTVKLIDSANVELDSLSYENSKYDKSFSYYDDYDVLLITDPTPGTQNIDIKKVNITDLNINQVSYVEGVWVDNGSIVDDTKCVLQDNTSFLLIKKDNGSCDLNSNVGLLGNLSNDKHDFVVIKRFDSNANIQFSNVLVSDINDNYLNMKYCFEGYISETYEGFFELKDQSGKILVYYDKTSDSLFEKNVSLCGLITKKYNKYRVYTNEIKLSYTDSSNNVLDPTGYTPIYLIVFTIFCFSLYIFLNKCYRANHI